MTGLLDVNVLIALLDPAHPNHDDAHIWFGSRDNSRWATCPLVQNGCVRVISNPGYPTVQATVAEVAANVRTLCGSSKHTFWADDCSVLDNAMFRAGLIDSHHKITDVYLLGLAVKHGGRLVSFDRSIPWKAVTGASAKHLLLLGG